MKTLTLDYATWRCGEGGAYEIGKGQTSLLNSSGFMCCLGQWSLQLGAIAKEIKGFGEPCEVKSSIPLLNNLENLNEDDNEPSQFVNTIFSKRAIAINDDMDTTPEEKILLLTVLCKEHEFELRVINKPTI